MKNKITACIVIGILVLFSFLSPNAYCQSYKMLTKQTTYDTKKAWSISYKMDINPKTVTNKNIFVKDKNNKLVPISLSIKNKKTIIISPKYKYTANSNYYLYVNANIKSLKKVKGKYISLSQNTIMPFYVKSASVNSKPTPNVVKSNFDSINFTSKELFTDVEVKAEAFIYRVTINDSEMIYEGDNTFKLSLVDLKMGGIATFKVYDKNNILIETKKITIK